MNIATPDICMHDLGLKTYPKPRFVSRKFSQVIAKSPYRIAVTDAYTAVNCAKMHVPWVKIDSEGAIILEWSNKNRSLFVKVDHTGTYQCVLDSSKTNLTWKLMRPSIIESDLFHFGKYLYGSETCEGSK